MIYWRTIARLTSSFQSFPSAVLKWRKVLRIRMIFYVTWQKIRYKKSLTEASNMFEKPKGKVRLSLHSGQVAHQAGAYPGFRSMKRLGVFLLPSGWNASPSQGYPPALNSPVRIYTPGWRLKCLAQEHNTMSPARARTRSARSGVERANHEATVPSIRSQKEKDKAVSFRK